MRSIHLALAFAASLPLFAAEYKISGPYTHDNLSIYLVHGQDRSNKRYLTLQEAMEQHKVIVYETSDVNTLAIANLSKEEDVYVQSGDIVKGGKQDRVLKEDTILPTASGKVPIPAFCVEHGRWTQRGRESAGEFESSKQAIAGSKMKMAVRAEADQRSVWDKVAEVQAKLGKNLAAPVQSSQSQSSLQLTLEAPKVKETAEAYQKEFAALIDKHQDAVGYVVAVNGKVTGADVYATHSLFVKLWPKLVTSASVEAIGADQPASKPVPPSFETVRAALQPADAKASAPQKVNARTEVMKKESPTGVLFETKDAAAGAPFVHRSYVAK